MQGVPAQPEGPSSRAAGGVLGQLRKKERACQVGEQHEQEPGGRSEQGRWDSGEGPGLFLMAMGQGPM